MNVYTVAERPDLAEPAWEATSDAFPEYNNHGDVLNVYWGGLTEKYPQFQFHLVDAGTDPRARRCLPVRWDGSLEDLPKGIDDAIVRGIDEGDGNALCAMVIQVPRSLQGRGLSGAALKAMADIGRAHGLPSLIAPVRPNWKERYPLTADRAVRTLAPRGRAAVRSVAARARAGRCVDPPDRARVAADHGHEDRMGRMGRDAVPGGR